MIRIILSRGVTALVDDEDADLCAHKWSAMAAKPYAVRRLPRSEGGGMVLMHRLIAERVEGRPLARGEVVDHRNGEGWDNRRENLRVVSPAENLRNRGGAQSNSKSGVLGVWQSARTGRWLTQIQVDGRVWSASGATREEAAAARLELEAQLWGVQPRRIAAHSKGKV